MILSRPNLLWLLAVLILVLTGCAQVNAPDREAVASPTATVLPYKTPDWFKGTTLYLIYVRSFADSDGDGTGDLQGITERLDYLQSLGINTLCLIPIYPSPSVHGYDVTDFTAVNPEYGDLKDLQVLVASAHQREMYVLLDFVSSHLSNRNPIFADAYQNPESKYSEWFVWSNEEHTRYAGFANLHEMPRFNHFNADVVQYLSDAALFWLDLDGDGDFQDGVDGFRIDNATFPPQEFFITFRERIKAVNPNALLLGETWVTNTGDLSRYFENQFDALFDFPLYSLLQGNQNFNEDGLLSGKISPALLSLLLEEQVERYASEGIPVRFANNHDTNRIATELGGDTEGQRMTISLLASLPGATMLYYGEEIGMPGQKGGPPNWDNYRREPMDWYADESGTGQTSWFMPEDRWNRPNDGVSVEEQSEDQDSLLNYYRNVLRLRAQHSALRGGGYEILDLQVNASGPWGMLRSADEEDILVLVNFSAEERVATIPSAPVALSNPIDYLSGVEYDPIEAGVEYTLHLPPRSSLWLGEGK